MKKGRVIIQWALLGVLTAAGLLALLVLMGEEADADTPFGVFAAWKAGALAVLAACLLIGKALRRKGLLPRELDEEI